MSSDTKPALKAFDNPDELWKMYFYVSFFNIGAYFFTNSASNFLQQREGVLTLPIGIFAIFLFVYLGVAYWLIKKQAVDKGWGITAANQRWLSATGPCTASNQQSC
jgi:hypothetical protein